MNYLGTYKSTLSIILGIIVFRFPKFCSFIEKFQSENTGFRLEKKITFDKIYLEIWKTCTAISTNLEKNKKFQFFRNASCLF